LAILVVWKGVPSFILRLFSNPLSTAEVRRLEVDEE
jgi:hypothetical protein